MANTFDEYSVVKKVYFRELCPYCNASLEFLGIRTSIVCFRCPKCNHRFAIESKAENGKIFLLCKEF